MSEAENHTTSTAPETQENKQNTEQFIKDRIEEYKAKSMMANEAMREGKGRLKLETPIKSGEETVEELVYDFNTLTGLELTNAMDSDPNSSQVFRITYRQALSLFAAAVAKNTDALDQRDIVEKLGITDAVAGVQLATLFFNASTRAGRLRISKK